MATILKEWPIYHYNDTGTSGNYFGSPWYETPSGDTWTDLLAGAAGNFNADPAEVGTWSATSTDKWWRQKVVDAVFDMSDYLMWDISAAKFWAYCYNHPNRDTIWPLASDHRLILNGQDETVRGLATSGESYRACIDGMEDADKLASDDFYDIRTDYSSTWLEYDFNASGLSYLNEIGTKANLQKHAALSLGPRGIYAGSTPTWSSGLINRMIFDEPAYEAAGFGAVWLSLYYDNTAQPCRIMPVADFKNVSAVQVNISGTWKDVVQVQVKTDAGVWKVIK